MYASRRGSSLIFVIVVILGLTAIILACANLSLFTQQLAHRRITKTQGDLYRAGIIEYLSSLADAQTLAAGTYNLTIDGKALVISVTDNDANIRRTFRATSTYTVDDNTYTCDEIVAGRQPAHPIYYGLYVGKDLKGDSITTQNDSNSAAHVDGKTDVDSLTVGGDFEANDTVKGTVSQTGQYLTNVSVATPTAAALLNLIVVTYILSADTLVLFGTTYNGYAFPSVTGSNPFKCTYVQGNVNLSGSLSGQGTIVVKGDLNLTGNISYADSSSRAFILVSGNLKVKGPCTSIAGTYYVTGDIGVDPASGLTVTRGNLISLGKSDFKTRAVTINVDRSFWNDRSLATRHKVPGFWPSVSVTGLLR